MAAQTDTPPTDTQPDLSRYVLPRFLESDGPVEFAARLEGISVEGSRAVLTCTTLRYERRLEPMYGTWVEAPGLETPGRTATLVVESSADGVLRFAYRPGTASDEGVMDPNASKLAGPAFVVSAGDASITLHAGRLRLVVARDPLGFELFDPDGALVWRTRPIDDPVFYRYTGFDDLPDDFPAALWHSWAFYRRTAYPLGIALDPDRPAAFVSFDLRHDEHVYGLGEGYGEFDRRGTTQRLWVQEALSNSSSSLYKGVPFYMTTRGHGVYVDTTNDVRFDVGNIDHTALSILVQDASALDWYVIYGPAMRDILPRYTSITGEPALPPKWSFGLWMSSMGGYNSRSDVERVADELRTHHIPCDVIHIDTNWFEHNWRCDYRFSRTRFPDPAAMFARLREQGFHTSLWQWPLAAVETDLFAEGVAGGYLVRRADGSPYILEGFGEPVGMIDYSNPAAVEWMRPKFRALFDVGATAIKADFGEGAPLDGVYAGGPGAVMHNLFPLLYNRALFGYTEEYFGRGEAVIWARSAWAGSQQYPVHWSGDLEARSEELPCVLRAMLSMGMSGFPFYSHDIGGTEGQPTPETYVRWAQLGLFSSHARCHGMPPREPWAYGEEAETIFRSFDELRYRLLPYIYSEAVICVRTSLPMARPLVLEFQDDPTTWTIDDEYLLGRQLLVAPILDGGDRRRVYLPEGTWVDYWTGLHFEGREWHEVAAPLDTLPLFVRGGSIVPTGPVTQNIANGFGEKLWLNFYAPDQAGRYTVWAEDGRSIKAAYRRSASALVVELGPSPVALELVLHDMKVHTVQIDGRPVEPVDGPNHAIAVAPGGGHTVTLELA